jgi:hypothetical protein
MTCDAVAAMLEKTLIHERDPRWAQEAARHAEGCPSCSRLLELHLLEERLTELSAVEPSRLLLENVMRRIAQLKPVSAVSSQGFPYDLIKHSAMFVGGQLLALAYLLPSAGESWLSNLRLAPGLSRTVGISAYLSQHPLWAMHLAGLAALMIVVGLVLPDRPVRENV